MDNELEQRYLKKLGEGGHEAFDALFTSYYPRVKSFLAGFINDGELAADMTQEIFFRIWINRETVSKVASFKGYLFRIARNIVYDHYNHSLIEEKYVARQRHRANNDLGAGEDDELHVRQLSLLIDLAVEKMPAQRRRVYTMSRTEGLTNEQIAEELNISKRTVENHITTALGELRKIVNTILPFFV